jgi:hypothetical protein
MKNMNAPAAKRISRVNSRIFLRPARKIISARINYFGVVAANLGNGPGVRVEINEAALAAQPEVPAGFQVRDFHGVADALDVAGGLRRLRPENGRNASF